VANQSVLVVEDDPALRQVYSDVLRDEGWTVHAAGDGAAALELLDTGVTPCVVVLDLRMPTMDGWTLVDRLRSSRWRTLPFVVLAAHYQVHEEARRMGARWWLQKPVPIDRFLHVVSEACASNGEG
jgi:two-component system cell cycle response regulator DivK